MARPYRIVGYAIVSADGMIADADGAIPATLKFDADQAFFHSGLARADLVVHGRNSHEEQPDSASRRRILVTSSVAGFAPDPSNALAVSWNPQGASFDEAWQAVGRPGGTVAIIGGTRVFSLFLDIGYDVFHLSCAGKARVPGGRPVFAQVGPGRTPTAILAEHGLAPASPRVLDAAADLTLITFERRAGIN